MRRKPKEEPDIDWGAAPQQPKRGRGRPRKQPQPPQKATTTPKPPQKQAPAPPPPPHSPPNLKNPLIDINNILGNNTSIEELISIDYDNLLNELNEIKIDEEYSLKEQKFLQIYLTGGISQEKAMDLAGYEHLSPRYKRFLAAKIVQKHESREGDHRKIMRALGWGEVKIILSLIEAATNFRSETVRLNARIALAKMGIKADLEGGTGIKILVIGGQATQATIEGEQARQVPGRTTTGQPALGPPPGPPKPQPVPK